MQERVEWPSGISIGPGPAPPRLTFRERQVLQLIAQGKSGKELSRLLGFSAGTASAHRWHIMEKLEIFETAGLVRYAIREGLIEP